MKMTIPLAAVLCALRFAPVSEAAAAATFPAAAVAAISVETDGGAIVLSVSSGAAVAAAVSPAAARGDDCAVSQGLRGGILTLAALPRAASSRGSRRCSTGFAVSAPAGVAIRARSRSGIVEIGAFAGAIDLRTDSGPIVLHRASGGLTLRTGSGNVTGRAGGQKKIDLETASGNVYLRGLTGSLRARSVSGDVAFAWATAPPVGSIDVRTAGGDLLATLPDDARLSFSMTSRSGKVRSDFRNDAAARLTLSFRSRSGYATIKKRLRSETMKDVAPDEVLDRRAILRW